MPSIYFRCDGVVTSDNGNNSQALSCSTGWVSISEPQNLEITGQLITLEQGRPLVLALITLIVVIAIYKALNSIFT